MNRLIQLWRNVRTFGIKIEMIKILAKVFSRNVFPKKIQIYFLEKKHQQIKKWLKQHYAKIIEKYKRVQLYPTNAQKSDIIWIFWWQGLEEAPELVKSCINSIKERVKQKEVVVLSQDNYLEYIEIPQEILEKVEKGTITKTFFSDMIRMNLLSQYGGFWMDATIFMTKNIFDEIGDKEFFTLKLNENDFNNQKMVSKGKWCGFFIGGESNQLFQFTYEFLKEYMTNQTQLIDYFLIDYVISIAYESFENVKNMIDAVPKNNEKIFELQKYLNQKYEDTIYQKIVSANKIHKLSYKEGVRQFEEGKITFYGKVVKKEYGKERT